MVVVAVVILCARANASEDAQQRMVRFLTPFGAAAVESPARVEVVRIAPDRISKAGTRSVAGYPLAGNYATVPDEVLARLKEFLLVPGSYSIAEPAPKGSGGGGIGNGCVFRPRYSLRFWSSVKGKRRPFDMLFCFSCDEVGVVATHRVRTMNIEPMRIQLARALSALLPDDRALEDIAFDREPLVGGK